MTTLRVISSIEPGLAAESVAGLFHRLNRVLPEDQNVRKLDPTTKVSEALTLMKKEKFSQIPVCEGKTVLGIFSHRSFAEGMMRIGKTRIEVSDYPVEEFIEKPRYAHITDEIDGIFEWLDNDNAVLVGESKSLQGIITPMDLLRYLYGVANHYVLIAEIEIGIRALIRMAVDELKLIECAKVALKSKYKPEDIPTRLVEMDFSDYISIISHGDNWNYFEGIFGGMRDSTRTKLVEICDLRNVVFHFKRELTLDDHQILVGHRDWVLSKAMKADARMKGAKS